MKYHDVWLIWSSAFLVPWLVLYAFNAKRRALMWRVSAVTALLGFTEPIFVPRYWNPPSVFELARRTGFDIESLLFAFAIGGIGAVLYNALRRQDLVQVSVATTENPKGSQSFFIGGDEDFLTTFEIELLKGRNFSISDAHIPL